MKRLAILLTALILATTITYGLNTHAEHKQPVRAVQSAPTPPTRAELLSLVNAERAKNGAAPLTEDSRLDQSAQRKADDEVKYNYFGHISPQTGKNSHDFISNTGINCIDSGENLTENIYVNDSAHAVNAWINSPPHHQAMIDTKFTLTGFGISNDQIVEHFCQQ